MLDAMHLRHDDLQKTNSLQGVWGTGGSGNKGTHTVTDCFLEKQASAGRFWAPFLPKPRRARPYLVRGISVGGGRPVLSPRPMPSTKLEPVASQTAMHGANTLRLERTSSWVVRRNP